MKKPPNRKRRAIRRVVIAAVLLLLLNGIFHRGYLLPLQVLRYEEQDYGCGRTTILYNRLDWSLRSPVYLSGNENAMILCTPTFTILGWLNGGGQVEDCSEPAPLQGAVRQFARESRSFYVYSAYAYGRIEDPAIQEVQIDCRVEWYENYFPVRVEATETITYSTSREDWREQDGVWYFLLPLKELHTSNGRWGSCAGYTLTGLDAKGSVVATLLS